MAEPQPLANALSELITLRGLANSRGRTELQDAWAAVAREWGRHTRALELKRGVLHVGVSNAALRSELDGYHGAALLAALRERSPKLRVRDLKFVLKGDLNEST
jgi:hypothetical protein